MSEYSLSVNDQALHAIFLGDDISWPDVFTGDKYITHENIFRTTFI